ncbi:toll/interleukin-1 receptor domain-containing protein [Kribbella sp. NPDC026596]|uniref:toll/interleukin-1 receptor domain-containing protein n=1 Tax=Kribbella sp. NPDC026596 TaxID=3155122 RepID=UPI0033D64C1D
MDDTNPASIFINYRTSDEPVAAALLDTALSYRFGAENVFLDCRSMAAGTPFEKALRTAVRRCDVLLVVIGRNWLTATDQHGRRLIDQRGDWVRTEIAEAYRVGAHVVPVLVGDVPALAKAALPPSIRQLASNQFVRLRPRDSRSDLNQLVAQLQGLLPRFADPSDSDPSAA